MKIVIDIHEEVKETFDKADDINFCFYDYNSVIGKAIRNGTPLPKGHGRLIDADAFIEKLKNVSKMQKYKEVLIDDYLTVDDVFKAIIESLQNEGLTNGNAPTIIEADKAESEE